MSPALQNLLDQLDESESDSIQCLLRDIGGDIGVQIAQLAQLSAIAESSAPPASTLSMLYNDVVTGAWTPVPAFPAREVSILNLTDGIVSIRTDPGGNINLPVNMSVSISVVANSNEIEVTGGVTGTLQYVITP